MKKNIILSIAFLCASLSYGQWYPEESKDGFKADYFWDNVQFGGSLGLGFGDGYTDLIIAPSALYNINAQFGVGAGLQYNYTRLKDEFSTSSYGVNLLGVYNPLPEVQLSLELEQLYVDQTIDAYSVYPEVKDSFWNTALFVGAGFNTGNVTAGIKYNILFNENDRVYSDSWMPFVRFYF